MEQEHESEEERGVKAALATLEQTVHASVDIYCLEQQDSHGHHPNNNTSITKDMVLHLLVIQECLDCIGARYFTDEDILVRPNQQVMDNVLRILNIAISKQCYPMVTLFVNHKFLHNQLYVLNLDFGHLSTCVLFLCPVDYTMLEILLFPMKKTKPMKHKTTNIELNNTIIWCPTDRVRHLWTCVQQSMIMSSQNTKISEMTLILNTNNASDDDDDDEEYEWPTCWLELFQYVLITVIESNRVDLLFHLETMDQEKRRYFNFESASQPLRYRFQRCTYHIITNNTLPIIQAVSMMGGLMYDENDMYTLCERLNGIVVQGKLSLFQFFVQPWMQWSDKHPNMKVSTIVNRQTLCNFLDRSIYSIYKNCRSIYKNCVVVDGNPITDYLLTHFQFDFSNLFHALRNATHNENKHAFRRILDCIRDEVVDFLASMVICEVFRRDLYDIGTLSATYGQTEDMILWFDVLYKGHFKSNEEDKTYTNVLKKIYSKNMILLSACQNNHKDVVLYLVTHDIGTQTLHKAFCSSVWHEHYEIVLILLQHHTSNVFQFRQYHVDDLVCCTPSFAAYIFQSYQKHIHEASRCSRTLLSLLQQKQKQIQIQQQRKKLLFSKNRCLPLIIWQNILIKSLLVKQVNVLKNAAQAK